MDMADEAHAREVIHFAESLSRSQRGRLVSVDGMSAEHCERCGASIPEVWRKAINGVRYCIECQEKEERERGQ
ncbi:MAG: TraR/DksA C4-type zinc finger protein [Pseudomonadota bacterium]